MISCVLKLQLMEVELTMLHQQIDAADTITSGAREIAEGSTGGATSLVHQQAELRP
jgi:hypothetical protein